MEVEQYIRQRADAYGVPQALALGLVNKESHFDQSLTGSKGEVGLCQILPIHKHEIDMKRAASDWRYNVTAGLFLLKQAYEFAKENAPNEVIAATYARYNGGQKNWKYYPVRNSNVHYRVYGQTIVRHGQPTHVDGYMDFYRKWGGK